MELDQMIANIRKCAMELETLELPGRYDEYSFHLLMAEIKRESKQLRDSFQDGVKISADQGFAPGIFAEKVRFEENNLYNMPARRIDDKLSRFWLYSRLRPIARKIYRKKHPYRTLDGKKLLAYDGEQFIRAAYKSILLREAEEEAVSSALVPLQKDYISKEEYLYYLMNSAEGKSIGIQVIGIKKKYRKMRRLHRLMRIPILGKLFRKKGNGLRVVQGKKLLKFSGEEFVKQAYREVLLREADSAALIYGMIALQRRDTSKEELIYSLAHSIEGMKQDITIAGIRVRYYLKRINRRLSCMPVLGHVLRWGGAVVFLPRRLRFLEHGISDCIASLYPLKQGYDALREKVEINSEDISTIKQRMEAFKQEIHNLERHTDSLQELTGEQEKALEQNVQQLDICLEGLQQLKDIYLEETLKKKEAQEKEVEDQRRKGRLIDQVYLHYNEKLMLDSRESVKAGMQIYLPYLEERFSSKEKENLKILDIGCGEGEWLELLAEHGYKATGIDSNQAVVEKTLIQFPQMDIVKEEAMHYLYEQEDETVDFISCIHMVEHLEFLEIMGFLQECFRVMKKGGMLLLETPNPNNILTSTYYFYLDPTHKRPIPKELLQFFVGESGFNVEDTLLLKPLNFIPYSYDDPDDKIKDIVFRFNMEQAYSIIATKA